jgi:hypothetical protein
VTARRDEKGRFLPGAPPGPGRPAGATITKRMVLAALLEGEGERIVKKAIEKALDGDATALRLLIDRLLPLGRARPVQIDLPEFRSPEDFPTVQHGIFEAVANGSTRRGYAPRSTGRVHDKGARSARFRGPITGARGSRRGGEADSMTRRRMENRLRRLELRLQPRDGTGVATLPIWEYIQTQQTLLADAGRPSRGLLLVPGPVDADEWTKLAAGLAEQQRKLEAEHPLRAEVDSIQDRLGGPSAGRRSRGA